MSKLKRETFCRQRCLFPVSKLHWAASLATWCHFASRRQKRAVETFCFLPTATFISCSLHTFRHNIRKQKPPHPTHPFFDWFSNVDGITRCDHRKSSISRCDPGYYGLGLIVAMAVWYAQLSQQRPCILETCRRINPRGQSLTLHHPAFSSSSFQSVLFLLPLLLLFLFCCSN